jgi:general secretion pathway protein G
MRFSAMPIPLLPRRAPAPRRVRRDGQSGVTLIEMMIVLVIIGIVAALVVPNVIGRPDEARVAVANADLRTISASLEMYRLDNRSYPTETQGLTALSQMPSEPPLPPNWVAGGYLPQVPTDPWGTPYVYTLAGNGGGYELLSLGADGQPGGDGVNSDLRHGAELAGNGAGG